MNIHIITIKSWNVENATIFQNIHPEHNVLISTILDEKQINKFKPDYIFFPHWSDKIPTNIYSQFECIVFHPTDLPCGRGGTPIQNLILRHVYDTKVSAISVTDVFDAGDIYNKISINIKHGTVESILRKISDIVFGTMIPHIINNQQIPTPQVGKVTTFKRRTKTQSDMMNTDVDLYDFIRMLDGEGYPPAFIIIGNQKIEFTNVQKFGKKLKGEYTIEEI